ncbi:hypothetical protein BGZ99_005126 [Dissophora globulifera]|uniref:Pkinase-domain-containing protein n=1 Tax=Dissophora globulifera TaxID=979702 RepID=A0A9P6RIG5_9FUNG|nr:hypothetical protein BGZ99_005126 [Dissophora globulifera]
MSEPSSATTTITTSTTAALAATAAPKKPRCWGSFEYEEAGQKHIVQFTKEGNDGESGVGGYVFGRKQECDFVLPNSPLVSGRHFLIYKEIVQDPVQKKAVERVFLKDISANGTFINDVKVGTNRRVQLKAYDKVNYLHEVRKSKDRLRFIFIEGEPVDVKTFDSQYERGPKLGSGNFATVFKATNRKSGIVYAVKVVKKNEGFSPRIEASLQNEIGTLMGIAHTNLLRVCEIFNEPSFYYIVTELAPDGELFDQIIDKQKFTEPETRHIFRQVLEGVKYLHDAGVVHRDLKPENILVMDKEAMTVKISDFGLAKTIGELVSFNTICGTPSYVAPEVISNTQYGKAVDMWSLGVVLYICLCGFPPFSDDLAPPSLREQVLQSMYTFPSPYWDEISDEAVDLVQGLLAQSPEDRLNVRETLEHVWMTMADDEGTMPSQSRTEPKPDFQRLLSRVMTERADRAVQRGVRVGYSQPTPFSQTIPYLPEDEDEGASQEIESQDYSQMAERGDTVDMEYGSGIGIFSQEGMVRGSGMDTDSEDSDDDDNGNNGNGNDNDTNDGSEYRTPRESQGQSLKSEGHVDLDGAAENESDRSFMSVQETFDGEAVSPVMSDSLAADKSMREASMNGELTDGAAILTALEGTVGRGARSESGSDTEERSSKRAKRAP